MPPQPQMPTPPVPPNVPPDMATPEMMQGGGAPPEQPEVTPEQKQALITLLQQVQARMQNFHATNFAAKNKVELLRRDLLKQVFQKLQLVGVDLTDRESVAAFLSKLQEQNPQLAAQFETAMSALLGGPNAGFEPPQGSIPPDAGQNPNETQNQNTPQAG